MKELNEKLDVLRTLVNMYALHLKHYNSAEVVVNKGLIIVTYFNDNQPKWYTFEAIEFPIEHLDKRINHYKSKLDRIKAASLA